MDLLSGKYRPPKVRVTKGRLSNLANARAARKAKIEPARTSAPPAAPPNPSPPSSPSPSEATTETSGRTSDKFELFENPEVPVNGDEYVLMHAKALDQLVGNFKCGSCGETLTTCLRDYRGSAVKVYVVCSKCEEEHHHVDSSPRLPISDTSRAAYDINRKMVAAFANNGLGHTPMMRVMSEVGVKVVDVSSYLSHFKNIATEIETLKSKVLGDSREAVRKAHSEEKCAEESADGILDIAVSVDGSWHKRGHTSMYGFVAVVEILTGLVVDYVVLSKFCHDCAATAAALGEDSPEYHIWERAHQETSQCSINYRGSSGNMEAEGAVILWRRSMVDCKMRYTTYLGDGDAKSFLEIQKHQPYGPDVKIEREECTNHVSKRLGFALRNLVAEKKTGGVTLGGKGEGMLTEEKMKQLQGYYHRALKANIGDEKKTREAILATIHHCSSTDERPKHTLCPKGTDSWCFYNKRKARKLKDLGSHKDMPLKLNQNVFRAIQPVYDRLTSNELLKRCLRGATQNANEALHHVIWSKCPKHVFVSRQRVELGAVRGVGEFNMGCERFLAIQAWLQKVPVPAVAKNVAVKIDRKRLKRSAAQSTDKAKKARVERKKKGTKKRASERKGVKKYVPGGAD